MSLLWLRYVTRWPANWLMFMLKPRATERTTMNEIKRNGWTVTKANDSQCVVKITGENRAPLVQEQVGGGYDDFLPEYREERDWGHADWPSDDEIASAASEIYGRKVRVRFSDACDGNLDEAIYNLE